MRWFVGKWLFVLLVGVVGCGRPVLDPTAGATVAATPTVGQQTSAEWDRLITAIAQNRWAEANDLARTLRSAGAEPPEWDGYLRYLVLYTLAGRVLDGSVSRDAFVGEARGMIGERLRLGAHTINGQPTDDVRVIAPPADEPPNFARRAVAIATNPSGTAVHFVERITLRRSFDFTASAGRLGQATGILRRVELDDSPTPAWVARLVLDDGDLQIIR